MIQETWEYPYESPDLLPELNDYDWYHAFAFSSGESRGVANGKGGIPTWVRDDVHSGEAEPFSRLDVAEVYGKADGENDGAEWLVYGLLKDGRYFFISAGCDYTGWDCQSGGTAVVASTRELLERLGMTNEERIRMTPPEPSSEGVK